MENVFSPANLGQVKSAENLNVIEELDLIKFHPSDVCVDLSAKFDVETCSVKFI